MRKIILTIADSDCCGRAGIQIDAQTISEHKMKAVTAITGIVSENVDGVYGIMSVSPVFVASQLAAILSSAVPEAIKIGIIYDAKSVDAVVAKLKQYEVKNIVLDTVLFSSEGKALVPADCAQAIRERLLPLADVVMASVTELSALCGWEITSVEAAERAAQEISEKHNCAVLIRSNQRIVKLKEYLYVNGKGQWIDDKEEYTSKVHGTNSCISSAIACNLADGQDMETAVKNALHYLANSFEATL